MKFTIKNISCRQQRNKMTLICYRVDKRRKQTQILLINAVMDSLKMYCEWKQKQKYQSSMNYA